MAVWVCPTHGRVEAEGPAPTCPMLLRRTIAGEAVAERCGQPLEPIEED